MFKTVSSKLLLHFIYYLQLLWSLKFIGVPFQLNSLLWFMISGLLLIKKSISTFGIVNKGFLTRIDNIHIFANVLEGLFGEYHSSSVALGNVLSSQSQLSRVLAGLF